jgi:hypothetical protein
MLFTIFDLSAIGRVAKSLNDATTQRLVLPKAGGHGRSNIKYTNLIVEMDRLPDPPEERIFF